jgi:hypothetical protein
MPGIGKRCLAVKRKNRGDDRVKGRNIFFSIAISFPLIYFKCFTEHTPNGVKRRGKQRLRFNKAGVKSYNSKNEGKITIRD